MSDIYSMRPIAHIRSDFSTKFGVPRQSGLVDTLEATVVFEPEFRNPDALRGLEGFSHIWLVWVFSASVRLAGVESTPDLGTVLRVRGADLMDGTPILDIKPYLPYGDCHPDAVGGFASAPAGAVLEVEIPPSLLAQVPEDRREALIGVLAQDPRPHYQKDSDRVYGFGFAGLEVRFTVSEGHLTVREILQAR